MTVEDNKVAKLNFLQNLMGGKHAKNNRGAEEEHSLSFRQNQRSFWA